MNPFISFFTFKPQTRLSKIVKMIFFFARCFMGIMMGLGAPMSDLEMLDILGIFFSIIALSYVLGIVIASRLSRWNWGYSVCFVCLVPLAILALIKAQNVLDDDYRVKCSLFAYWIADMFVVTLLSYPVFVLWRRKTGKKAQ